MTVSGVASEAELTYHKIVSPSNANVVLNATLGRPAVKGRPKHSRVDSIEKTCSLTGRSSKAAPFGVNDELANKSRGCFWRSFMTTEKAFGWRASAIGVNE